MNKVSLITQVIMIVVAVTIVLMYIQPKISTIRDTQDITTSYQTETENVSAVNASLKAKIAAIEAIAPQDAQALARFIPDTVDEISVLKDISNIVEAGSVSTYDVAYDGDSSAKAVAEAEAVLPPGVTEHYFSISFESNYSQLKSVLSLLETNNYLLQVANLKVATGKEGFLTVDLSVVAFARTAPVTEVAP